MIMECYGDVTFIICFPVSIIILTLYPRTVQWLKAGLCLKV